MKNIVICCDGTWKKSDDVNASNIEKIARVVDTRRHDGVDQIVYYNAGVGTGATRFERLAGGAFGLGLDEAIVSCYRFLALNYEVGDHVYVFGFSRGAYTARSLIGMIDRLGLLTPTGVARNLLPQAIELYRGRLPMVSRPAHFAGSGTAPDPTELEAARAAFRAHCHDSRDVIIRFLGVMDTVGTLGVPGLTNRRYRFHNVDLCTSVVTARHALAIHERRRAFAPAVWTAPPTPPGTAAPETPDVKQVWFDGVHSDVGGGYADCGLSDTVLRWILGEAAVCGLVIDDDLLAIVAPPDGVLVLHDSMTGWYRAANLLGVLTGVFRAAARTGGRFRLGWRVMEVRRGEHDDLAIMIWDPAYQRSIARQDGSFRSGRNVFAWYGILERIPVSVDLRRERSTPR
ncbi:DUF2235 domain-containing protein [Williamsia sterculiae]|uniref:Uncharacterized alpha/beta hydrolase domain n=1 Tax=Williamsia sterculiae TaxID=1344003 RepID=A0A1N7EC95_9NOCA|nr:DUF2235 domain-containing protein [Williamsia sterculiae]SIR85707.1 Uncharacterized alpha/beta hydrolase domain [Williamsia sterculiae]